VCGGGGDGWESIAETDLGLVPVLWSCIYSYPDVLSEYHFHQQRVHSKNSTKYIDKEDPNCIGFEPVATTKVSVYAKISIFIIHKK